ncbi:chemotaxis protein CheB [Oryzibacter oryziterrae]|uniref:chemotaxis protein CheB n=1 Tax=Oryzibacter oryziterrae TaxID=2766474 RepID=UPI001F02E62F|nr:chemotaxis protein CheB [Oryzibacter oryziterrae]
MTESIRPETGAPSPLRHPVLQSGAPPGSAVSFPVVAIGASAGGLDACRKLIAALPPNTGMAFLLVQHLDPSHESLLVDLLAGYTSMQVQQARDGQAIEPDHLYVMPPGTYLSVLNGVLALSEPSAPHGARLPFDFLLNSLAENFGSRVICVVLSGNGADGSLGLQSVKAAKGLVLAQDPLDATYDGMPKSAIATGLVDSVLPVAQMPRALAAHQQTIESSQASTSRAGTIGPSDLEAILDLVRTRTVHDFTPYKRGTLQRRIERRMETASNGPLTATQYLNLLGQSRQELDQLVQDLLINVTQFFRDPQILDRMVAGLLPELIRKHPKGRPFRVWIAGCSSGEEAYSLAILLLECVEAERLDLKLQVFASDVDPEAIATARAGLYPASIEADVSPERLAKFFLKEEQRYRIAPGLRASIVFTVQDLLTDPPFSHLDLISCRNVLIYLGLAAQAKVIDLFHFALNTNGTLLLGSAETIKADDDRFELVSKTDRVYRRTERPHVRGRNFGASASTGLRPPARAGADLGSVRQNDLADLCRRKVLEAYAPATVLVNRRHECMFFLGPTERFLSLPKGTPSYDLFAMVPALIHTALRSALRQAETERRHVVVPAAPSASLSAHRLSISIDPVQSEGETFFLVSFEEKPRTAEPSSLRVNGAEDARVEQLSQELAATRAELQHAVRDLEVSATEQKAIYEEALSVNEEYQSTNEELLASKEELQSLNEELTVLNTELQETLDRQRTTANDLRNVLFSTDIATIFLDQDFRIRFFTPAATSVFTILPGDIGRPLANLRSMVIDDGLLADAQAVLKSQVPREREISAEGPAWYVRRILPYRTQSDGVEGVVITFTDITERRRISEALTLAEHRAQRANLAKSRFLAAASHDLRQPLQTLSLLHGLLAKRVEGDKGQDLMRRFEDTLGVMGGMLNTLLDINQIEAGTIQADIRPFAVSILLQRISDEFSFLAEAKGLDLRVIPSSLVVHSDPDLLGQMLRNLVANAVKYTAKGRVLVGCRHRSDRVDIEVWDTGLGIPADQQQAIFEEYHQVDNVARQRDRGLGLGLAIVRRLGTLLNATVDVGSTLGKGSVFTLGIPTIDLETTPGPLATARTGGGAGPASSVTGNILVIEDDPAVRDLLEASLRGEGHRVAVAADGNVAIEAVARRSFHPDLVLADFNLPGGRDGLKIAAEIRHLLNRSVPVVILSGDIATATLHDIAGQNCVHLTKPIGLPDLYRLIDTLLRKGAAQEAPAAVAPASLVQIVDDDDAILDTLRLVLEADGRAVETFASAEAFLATYVPHRQGCLLVDAYLPGMSGLELLARLSKDVDHPPAIMITGNSDVGMAVQAMKAGALDFIDKPIGSAELLAVIDRAIEQASDQAKRTDWRDSSARRLAGLTPRQHQIMDLVLAGQPSKIIAADLGISQRTVENHRASIMKRTGTKSLPELARLVLTSAG